MQPVDRESLKNFKARLLEERRTDPVCASKEVVKASFSNISKARERRVNWDRIAELLMETTEIKLSSSTLRRYYYEISQEREKKLSPKTTNASMPSKKRTKKSATISDESLNLIPLKATELDNDSGASTNGSDAGLTQSPKEAEPSPLVEEALRTAGSFDHWKEPVFNVNRVRPVNTET
jgi:hypothetical protein